jgi:hypothetical protein
MQIQEITVMGIFSKPRYKIRNDRKSIISKIDIRKKPLGVRYY